MLTWLFVALLSIPYPQHAGQGIAPPDDCARYYGAECKNWKIATWLPELGPDLGEPAKNVARVYFMDGFTSGSPTFGTPFVYGNAGPPRGRAIYDARHHLAFYRQGCCAWQSIVLAAGVGSPPIAVEDRVLTGIRTEHGLYLGVNSQRAQAIYGNAIAEPVKGIAGIATRSYRYQIPPPASPTCEQDTTLGFYRDRLIYIRFTNAC